MSAKLTGWEGWVRRPQMLGWRRAVVQIHLWLGLALGLYVVVLSVTGSFVVLRPEFHLWLIPRTVAIDGTRLTADELHAAVQQSYPNHEVREVRSSRRLASPATVTLHLDGETTDRLFDPYTGADLGLAYPPILHAVEWVVDLHDNLLAGSMGRTVNGIGGALVIAVAVTGLVLWWPGRTRWREGLTIGPPAKTRRFALRLHNALGFWSFAMLLVWCVTAVYFAFPEIAEVTIDFFDDDLTDAYRPGDDFLQFLIKLHFGRFGGLAGRLTWVALGLLPAVLFVTGFIMWWIRVVRRRVRVLRASPTENFAFERASS